MKCARRSRACSTTGGVAWREIRGLRRAGGIADWNRTSEIIDRCTAARPHGRTRWSTDECLGASLKVLRHLNPEW